MVQFGPQNPDPVKNEKFSDTVTGQILYPGSATLIGSVAKGPKFHPQSTKGADKN
jgi:hypothetical protein